MSCLFKLLYRCVEPAPPTIVRTLPVSAMQSLLVAGLTASQGIWHFTSRLHMFSISHNFFLSLLRLLVYIARPHISHTTFINLH